MISRVNVAYVVLASIFSSSFASYLFCVDNENAQNVEIEDKKCVVEYSSLAFAVVDTADKYGTYNMTFSALTKKCKFNYVDIYFEMLDGATESTCTNENNLTRKSHSKYSLDALVLTSCTKMKVTIPVPYIIKGCYVITFSPYWLKGTKKQPHSPLIYSKWINSSHTTSDFKLKPSFATINYADKIDLKWKFKRDVDNMMHSVTVRSNASQLHNSSAKVPTCEAWSENFLDVTQNCSLLRFEINCFITCLRFGTYSVSLTLKDNLQCTSKDNVFFVDCGWKDTFERIWHPAKVTHKIYHGSRTKRGTSLLILMIIAIIVFVCIVLFFLSRSKYLTKKQSPPLWSERVTAEVAIRQQSRGILGENRRINGIFLIYARDCQPFMNFMYEFRKILQESTGCKVYDLFDDDQFEEILKSPHEWVQEMLKDNTIKVVLVATEVGEIIHRRMIKHYAKGLNEKVVDPGIFVYQTPDFMDAYVLYTLKLISVNEYALAPYQKFFVCRIPSVMKNTYCYDHINPLKRYNLPSSLSYLMKSLMTKSRIPLVEDYADESDQDCHRMNQKLLNSLNNLKSYVDANPKYLSEILLPGE